jgi:hypothetical protein
VARQAHQFVFGGLSILGASSYQNVAENHHPPEHTLDGDLGSRWSALGDGEWIAYDLGRVMLVSSVGIAFHVGDTRTSTFDIQLSNDGVTWEDVLTGAVSSGSSLAPETFDFPGTLAHYLRIIGHGNSTSLWNSYTEVEVVGTPIGDSEPDGLPDEWEMQNFGSFDQTGAGDPDGDGYSNADELTAGTNPAKTYSNPGDTDEDGLPDAWEMANFGSLAASGSVDSDSDGSNNRDEYLAGTDPEDKASYPTDRKLRWVLMFGKYSTPASPRTTSTTDTTVFRSASMVSGTCI